MDELYIIQITAFANWTIKKVAEESKPSGRRFQEKQAHVSHLASRHFFQNNLAFHHTFFKNISFW